MIRSSASEVDEQNMQSGGTVDDFHALYYNNFAQTWEQTYWLGCKVLKCPLDLWIYQELLHRLQPDLVIECGTAHGGSALFLASIMDLLGHGQVLTIDHCGPATFPARPQHPRIHYHVGSSTAHHTLEVARDAALLCKRVLVILDSDHRRDHVMLEMAAYAPLVTAGSYLIVEDSNINGHPVEVTHGPGPMEAIDVFLPHHPEFEIDTDCEKFFLTFNPRGYLRRR